MEAFRVNKKSWHYRLATVYANYESYRHGTRNICDYSKSVLRGIISVVIVTAFCSMVLVPFSDIPVWLFAMVSMGVFIEPALAVAGMLLIFGVLVACIVFAVHNYLSNREKPVMSMQNTFVGKAYASWKEKFCLPIKIVDN